MISLTDYLIKKYSYTKSRNKIKLKIDNSEMTFKKE